MQHINDRNAVLAISRPRTLVSAALLAMLAAPLAASAQSPKPSPAIKNTQSGIRKAQQQQLHAQTKAKTSAQKVGTGGAHPDSEVPNNPGESAHKPGAGPGYAGGRPAPVKTGP